ncbi:DUF1853 family protein [Arenibacter sp. F26102]|uniref:DUF1853 family protein n=1 Tax=Arenibacter sp. F26102 TaxID=2926416 RepID=UPI001FF23953|nr:DUF1853 family protein [Arenibacter sp. F26102]MCK0145878.1 DUF1853 family protein [Arenibacter sp. F26102]
MDHKNLSYYRSFFQTPPLWNGNLDGLEQFRFPKIDFGNLETKVIPSNLRFGHKIEHIFQQLIQHSQDYKLIAHNIPIRKNKVSMGEIDFLVQNVDDEMYTHVELTYKFYVLRQDTTIVQHQLIGPNQRDSFYAKKEKIFNHQIPLLNTPEAISVLKELNIDISELRHQVCFKCQLFIPYEVEKMDLAPFNSECIAGRWITLRKFRSSNFLKLKYYLPTKSEWLLEPSYEVAWLTYNEVLGFISNRLEDGNSPMLWVKIEESKIEKLFIVWW